MKVKNIRRLISGLLPLTLVSIGFWAGSWAHAQLATSTDQHTTLVVFADRRIVDHVWPVLTETLKRESAVASLTTPLDGNPDIVFGGLLTPGPQLANRIEVQLLGRCDAVLQAYNPWPPLPPGPLGWVYGSAGRIQPDIRVDCTRLAKVIMPIMSGMSRQQRVQAMSQAISNIIVHEWIHVATQSSGHTSRGVCQPQLSADELISPTLVRAVQVNPQQNDLHDFVSAVRSKP